MKAPILLMGCLALLWTVSAVAQDDQVYDQNAPGYTDQAQPPSPAPRDQMTQEQPARPYQGNLNLNTQRIDEILGLQGQASRTGVYIVRIPPRFTNVTVAGIQLPASALPSSTVSFKNIGGNRTLVSADLILLQNQVNPAIDAALANGLQVTGLHDPFLWDSPRVVLMHVSGTADTNRLATAINRVLTRSAQGRTMGREMRESGTQYTCPEDTCYSDSGTECGICPTKKCNICPSENTCPTSECPSESDSGTYRSGAMMDGGMDLSSSGVNPEESNLDQTQIQNILNARPLVDNGALKFNFAKSTTVNGQRIGWAMGVKSMAIFAGSNDRAIVTGDLAAYEGELQGVLRALRQANINILAIGSHMTNESPRVIFVHFMGVGRATDLARGIRSALDVPARGMGPAAGTAREPAPAPTR